MARSSRAPASGGRGAASAYRRTARSSSLPQAVLAAALLLLALFCTASAQRCADASGPADCPAVRQIHAGGVATATHV